MSSTNFDPNGAYQVRGAILNEFKVPAHKVDDARIMEGLVFTEADLESALERVCKNCSFGLPQNKLETLKNQFSEHELEYLLADDGNHEFAEDFVTQFITKKVFDAFSRFVQMR